MHIKSRRLIILLLACMSVVCINVFMWKKLPIKGNAFSEAKADKQSENHNSSSSQLFFESKHISTSKPRDHDIRIHYKEDISKSESSDLSNYDNSKNHTTKFTQGPIQRKTVLKDIYISVKTTGKYHNSRLNILLETWFLLAREETYFFTDVEDDKFSKKSNGHLVNTQCSSQHNRIALCCKMAYEYDAFIESQKRWFCHVDDDTYLNVPRLEATLQLYNHTDDWYLGKPSLSHPIQVPDRDNPGQQIAFWFATGGAGFCISRSLALKMLPIAGGGRLNKMCDKIRLPDDCTIGYIICNLLGVRLTVLPTFHSHLEGLWMLKSSEFHKQLTFSYSNYGNRKANIININNGINKDRDPTRLLSIHCFLFPNLRECIQLRTSTLAS